MVSRVANLRGEVAVGHHGPMPFLVHPGLAERQLECRPVGPEKDEPREESLKTPLPRLDELAQADVNEPVEVFAQG